MNSKYKTSCDPLDWKNVPFGDGYYKTIIDTDQVNCGELFILSHGKGGYDSGHIDADEVFYIKKGTATIRFPESNENADVSEGCYIMMPRSQPHIIFNNTDDKLFLIFFCIKRK